MPILYFLLLGISYVLHPVPSFADDSAKENVAAMPTLADSPAIRQKKLELIVKKIKDLSVEERKKNLIYLPDSVKEKLASAKDLENNSDFDANRVLESIDEKDKVELSNTLNNYHLGQLMGALELLDTPKADLKKKIKSLIDEKIDGVDDKALSNIASGIDSDVLNSNEPDVDKAGQSNKQANTLNSDLNDIDNQSKESQKSKSDRQKIKELNEDDLDTEQFQGLLGDINFAHLDPGLFPRINSEKIRGTGFDSAQAGDTSLLPQNSNEGSNNRFNGSSLSKGNQKRYAQQTPDLSQLFNSPSGGSSNLGSNALSEPNSNSGSSASRSQPKKNLNYGLGRTIDRNGSYRKPYRMGSKRNDPATKKERSANGFGIPFTTSYANNPRSVSHCQGTAIKADKGDSDPLGCRDSTDGLSTKPFHMLTARHCVTEQGSGSLQTPSEINISEVGAMRGESQNVSFEIHPTQDIAVITVDRVPCERTRKTPILSLSDSNSPRGDKLYIDGRHMMAGQTEQYFDPSSGIQRMSIHSGIGIFQGDSGGPVVNQNLELVGAISMKDVNDDHNAFFAGNIGWAQGILDVSNEAFLARKRSFDEQLASYRTHATPHSPLQSIINHKK